MDENIHFDTLIACIFVRSESGWTFDLDGDISHYSLSITDILWGQNLVYELDTNHSSPKD